MKRLGILISIVAVRIWLVAWLIFHCPKEPPSAAVKGVQQTRAFPFFANHRLPFRIRAPSCRTMHEFTKILVAIATSWFAAEAVAEPLAEGSALPSVAQKNQDEQSVTLSEAGATGYLLVYFYPKADTPGCTKQACSLRDAFAALTEKGVRIYGVSKDSAKSQKAFKQKYQLPFDLLADEDGVVVTAFGVPRTMGFTKRQAFLFKEGLLVWRDLAASTDQQAADVLKVVAGRP